jgi:hypothetical protein
MEQGKLRDQVCTLAYHGKWGELLSVLRDHPELVNVESGSNGYSPLHQAAWHGANLSVVGGLLKLGADRSQKTRNKGQVAHQIACEKHEGRQDLEYILAPGGRNLSQLIRKVMADNQDLFDAYDGNQLLCDRLVECFCSSWGVVSNSNIDETIDSALMTLTGGSISFCPAEHFNFETSDIFWTRRFLPALRECVSKAYRIPIEEKWAVISDLFDPAPTPWGLRGDLFLWMEMRQALCHAEIPRQPDGLIEAVSAAFRALTGTSLERDATVQITRFARGGMSGGMVSGEFWSEQFIPLLVRRSAWLRQSWG